MLLIKITTRIRKSQEKSDCGKVLTFTKKIDKKLNFVKIGLILLGQ